MSSTRTARVLLEYEVNQQSARKAEESAKQVQRGLTGLTQAEKDVAKANQLSARTAFELEKGFNATSKSILTTEAVAERMNKQLFALARQKAVDTLAGDFIAMEKQAGSTAVALEMVAKRLREIGASDNEINRVTGQIANMSDASAGAGGTSAGRGLQRAGMALFNAPAIGASTPIARGLIMVGNLADKTGASMGQLGAAMGLAGVALTGVAIAMAQFNEQLKASKQLLQGALGAQTAYYQAIDQFTTEQVRQSIAELEAQARTLGAQRAETQNALEQSFQMAQQSALGDIGARALFNQLPTGLLQERLDELNLQAAETDQTIVRLVQGINAGAFAANDAAEAERVLAEARMQTYQQQAALEVRVESMTAEMRQQRIAELETEIGVYLTLIDRYGETSAEAQSAAESAQRLNNELAFLQGVVETTADRVQRLAAQQQAMSDQTDQLFEYQTRLVQSYEEATKAYQAITDLNNQTNARLAEIEADRIQKRADAEAKAADDLATAQADADEKKVEALKQYEEEKQRIERTYLSSRNKAIAERDAVALLDARQKRKEDLIDLAEKQKKQEEAIDKAYDKQKKAIEKRLAEQLAAIEKANSETLRKEADRYKQELAIRQQAHQAALVSAQNIENQLAAIRNNAAAGRVIAEYQMYSDIYQNARFWLTSIAQFIAGGLGGAGGYLQGVATGKTPGGVGKANYAANVGVTVNAGGDARQIAKIAAAAAERATYKTMRTAMTQSGVIGGR